MEPVPPQVNVTLLLAGGHSPRLKLPSDDPLLHSLLASIEDKTDGGVRVPRPYHLKVDDGKRSLIFSGRDLIGVVVDPPITLRRRALPAGEASSPYLLVENFLDPGLHAELLRFALEAEPRFVDSTVTTSDKDYRISKVLYDFPRFSTLFRERIGSLAGRLTQRFAMQSFPVAEIECQMTAHNDGHYFKLHNDNGSPETKTRAISYVYYFYGEPKGFSGGEFRLYHSRVENGLYQCGEAAADLPPKDNSILFFPSHCHHEVLPVRCASGAFKDSRFTINGWIRRPAA